MTGRPIAARDMQHSLVPHKRVEARTGSPISAKGFRPFFILAATFAASIIVLWLLVLFGVVAPTNYLDAPTWHAHEMVFGFAVAVIAGFLLTAVGNWTKVETVTGKPLLALCAVWLAGRVAMTIPSVFPRGVVAIIDLAFLPLLGVAIGRPLIVAKNRRNFIMVGLISALFIANTAIHLDALGVVAGWRGRGCLLGVDVVILLIAVMAGRVFPMFTRNATRVESIRSSPTLDVLAIAAMLVVTVFDVALPNRFVGAFAATIASVLAAARALHWGTLHTRKYPLVWILHVGYAWIPIGLLLHAIALVTTSVPATSATHALTAGAIGALTLGMMTRVTLGHTGRLLEASRSTVFSFVCVTFAAIVRVAGPLLPFAWYRPALTIAGTSWSVAFAIYLFTYAPVLVSPRLDGTPG